MLLYFILHCVGNEIVNVHIGHSNGDDGTFPYTPNNNPTISPSQQEVGSVYRTTTTIENLPTVETGIELFKLKWGEFMVALCHIGRVSMRTMEGIMNTRWYDIHD